MFLKKEKNIMHIINTPNQCVFEERKINRIQLTALLS